MTDLERLALLLAIDLLCASSDPFFSIERDAMRERLRKMRHYLDPVVSSPGDTTGHDILAIAAQRLAYADNLVAACMQMQAGPAASEAFQNALAARAIASADMDAAQRLVLELAAVTAAG